jgi:hypothetical protein
LASQQASLTKKEIPYKKRDLFFENKWMALGSCGLLVSIGRTQHRI